MFQAFSVSSRNDKVVGVSHHSKFRVGGFYERFSRHANRYWQVTARLRRPVVCLVPSDLISLGTQTPLLTTL